MTFKTLLTAAAFTVTSALASHACPAHEQHTMSCAEGTTYDSATRACVPVVDLAEGRIVVDPPEGLLEDAEEEEGQNENGQDRQ